MRNECIYIATYQSEILNKPGFHENRTSNIGPLSLNRPQKNQHEMKQTFLHKKKTFFFLILSIFLVDNTGLCYLFFFPLFKFFFYNIWRQKVEKYIASLPRV